VFGFDIMVSGSENKKTRGGGAKERFPTEKKDPAQPKKDNFTNN